MSKLISKSKLNVIVSAYACSPYQGSEAGVGWGFVKELAKLANLTVFVEAKFRQEIQDYCNDYPEEPVSTVRFIYVKRLRLPVLRRIYPPSYYWTYRAWHRKVYKIAHKLITRGEIKYDLAHQLTMVGFREPGYLFRTNLPFIIGPVGGAGYFPKSFITQMGLGGAFYYICYNIYNFFHMRFHRRLREISCKGDVIAFAATHENSHFLNKLGFDNVTVIPEVGISLDELNQERLGIVDSSQVNIVWCGQLIPRKGLKFLISTLAGLKQISKWHLHVVGDGVLRASLESQVHHLGLSGRVSFYGSVSRENVRDIMFSCDIGVITSLRDLSSTVTVEMQNAELAMIVPNHSGFSALCDNLNAILIGIDDPETFQKDLKAALSSLINDERKRQELSMNSKYKLENIRWDKKAETVYKLYNKLKEI